MKLQEINKAMRKVGLEPFEEGAIEVGLTSLVVDRAFHSHQVSRDYRAQAYGELLAIGMPFRSDSNIHRHMVAGLVAVTCPYCLQEMELGGSGGNFETSSYEYRCKEGHKVQLEMLNNGILVKKSG